MNKVLLQAHRGVAAEYPENTMVAFRAAVDQGYDIIELDPDYTGDGAVVVFHDQHRINRTARNRDGSIIEKEIPLRNITYAEALQYDYGIWFDIRYKGEKLLLLEEALDFAFENNIPVKLDNKIQDFPDPVLNKLLDICDKTKASLGFTCKTIEFAKMVSLRYPNAHIHYDGEVNEQNLQTLSSFADKDKLTVWIAYPNELTEWVRVPRASKDLCRMIKKYARLGIWIIQEEKDFADACENLGADVVETTGKIKPRINKGCIADMHTHSKNSHDSDCDIEKMALAQIEKGTKAFAITDHCDVEHSDTIDAEAVIRSSYNDAVLYGKKFASRISVLRGVEMGMYPQTEELQNKILAMHPYDAVIGSVHTLKINGKKQVYSRVDFSDMPDEEIYSFLEEYFREIIRMLNTIPIDILAHLTCPLRYITGKFGRNIDISVFDEYITRILEHIITHAIALEINTSGYPVGYNTLIPSENIIEKYKAMGGYLITIGSDAHTPENASVAFEQTIDYLKKIGFENIYMYKNRIAIPCKL